MKPLDLEHSQVPERDQKRIYHSVQLPAAPANLVHLGALEDLPGPLAQLSPLGQPNLGLLEPRNPGTPGGPGGPGVPNVPNELVARLKDTDMERINLTSLSFSAGETSRSNVTLNK